VDTAVPTEPCFPLYLIAVSSHFITINNENWLPTIRSDSGEEVNILGGDISVSARKDIYVNMCRIVNGYRDWAILTYKINSIRFFLWIWMQREVYNWKIIKRDKFPARIVYVTACTERCEDKLRRKRSDIRTRAAKCIEVDGRIFEHLLQTAKKFKFRH